MPNPGLEANFSGQTTGAPGIRLRSKDAYFLSFER